MTEGLVSAVERIDDILDCLGQDDKFEAFEGKLNQDIIHVYDLRAKRVRVDTLVINHSLL